MDQIIAVLYIVFWVWVGWTAHRILTIFRLAKAELALIEKDELVIEVEAEKILENYHIRKFDTKEFLAQGQSIVSAGEAALDRLPKGAQIRVINVIE